MSGHGPLHKVELSAVLSVIGILLLFSVSVMIILIAPSYVDKSWTEPTSPYQVQVYELADPNVFISGVGQEVMVVNRIVEGLTYVAFKESETLKIQAPEELQKYITKKDETTLKLVSKVLLLKPLKIMGKNGETFELYDPQRKEAFLVGTDSTTENWVDKDFVVLENNKQEDSPGLIFQINPREFLYSTYQVADRVHWRYDPAGKPIDSVEEMLAKPLEFLSRKQLIELGEHIYAIEGCSYCHTDQTRTLVQDLVLNGSDSYPAPPSSANEYIYQKVSFPGTKRNGPDLSRVGVKRPSRDWHKSHFWSPKTQNRGSIMPSFRHFFDFDPRGTARSPVGVPNYQFEAIFQYLMTKGTRITPPTQAWWTGKDPLKTIDIIEGRN